MASSPEMSRFDVRLPKEQKDYFESVLDLGGFRSLTDFVVSAAIEKANFIMESHKNWLSSEKDKEIFFKTLTSPPSPNPVLKAAAKRYKGSVRK